MRLKNYESLPSWPVVQKAKPRSMLHWETLSFLWKYSREIAEPILELGTYVGGATVVMASARKPRSMICVQPPAAHLVHPTMPTDDVLRDLYRNLLEFDVADCVDVVEKRSYEALPDVERLLGDQKIGMLVIDSDGAVGRDIDMFRHLLAPNCRLVLDDYGGFHKPQHAPDKQEIVRAWVAQAKDAGLVEETAVVPWGTWFGVLK